MKSITIDSMLEVESGNEVLAAACGIIEIGTGVYGIGLVTNWWNPIGWVSAVGGGLSAACDVWAIAAGIQYMTSR